MLRLGRIHTIAGVRLLDFSKQLSASFQVLFAVTAETHKLSAVIRILIELIEFLFEQSKLVLAVEEQPRLKISKATVDAETLAAVFESGQIWIPRLELVN